MSNKVTYTVRNSRNEIVATRTTATKYTHAVIREDQPEVQVVAYSSRKDLADTVARRVARVFRVNPAQVIVVALEVTKVTKPAKPAKATKVTKVTKVTETPATETPATETPATETPAIETPDTPSTEVTETTETTATETTTTETTEPTESTETPSTEPTESTETETPSNEVLDSLFCIEHGDRATGADLLANHEVTLHALKVAITEGVCDDDNTAQVTLVRRVSLSPEARRKALAARDALATLETAHPAVWNLIDQSMSEAYGWQWQCGLERLHESLWCDVLRAQGYAPPEGYSWEQALDVIEDAWDAAWGAAN